MTVKLWPAIVKVPVRADPRLAATVNVTVPLPVRDAPVLMVSQAALLTAVHAHVLAVVTLTVGPLPPSPSIEALVGLMAKVQGGGAGAAA